MIRTNIHPEIIKKFGIFLKREKTGLSQRTIGKGLGFKTAQTLSNIERGLCVTPLHVGKKLVVQYGLDTENFIEYLTALHKLNLQIKFGLVKDIRKVKLPKFKKKS